MKIAVINQPQAEAIPKDQSVSISLITNDIANFLSSSSKVVVYGKGNLFQKEFIGENGVSYISIWNGLDNFLQRVLNKFNNLLGGGKARFQIFASIMYFPFYILQIALNLRKQNCDIIHIHNFSQYIPVVRALNPKSKIVLHMNCEWLSQLKKSTIEKRIRKTDLIIGCSDFVTNKIINRFPEYKSICHTVFNGVNIKNFFPEETKNGKDEGYMNKLLFIGRISPEKGVHVLIEAFKDVVQKYPNTKLQLIGHIQAMPEEFSTTLSDEEKTKDLSVFYEADYGTYLQKMITPDIKDNIEFSGVVPNSQLAKIYQSADVFVFPSQWHEPFGIPNIEAMACKIPVVATKSGGITEIVDDGKTGYLVERGDPVTLAESINNLLSDKNLRHQFGAAGYKKAHDVFSWQQISNNLLNLYKNLLQNHN